MAISGERVNLDEGVWLEITATNGDPATRHIDPMLGRRRRRWAYIGPTLVLHWSYIGSMCRACWGAISKLEASKKPYLLTFGFALQNLAAGLHIYELIYIIII